jgi:hypothetical protein
MNKRQNTLNTILAAFLMLLFAFNGTAQTDDLETQIKPSKKTKIQEEKHSPKKAMLLSTVLPGAGQVYNKKAWKIPIIYAGIGVSVYAAFWKQDKFDVYRNAWNIRNDGNEDTKDEFDGVYSDLQLIQIQNFYDKNKEVSIAFAIGFYALNILDANVDAHLFEFDVSDDLSMKLEPTVMGFSRFTGTQVGLKLNLKF